MSGARARTPWRHGVALWLLVMACESVNGSLRELVLVPWIGRAAADAASFAVASLLVLGVATVFARWMRAPTVSAQFQVGALWAVLTVAFEAVLTIARGLPMDAFVATFDPTRGGPMLGGVVVLLLAPWLGARLGAGREGDDAATRPGHDSG